MTGLPQGWTNVQIPDVLADLPTGNIIDQGWSPKCENFPSGSEDTWGALKTTAIQDGRFEPQHTKQLPEHLEPKPALEVREGDLLMTCAGPRVRCGVICRVERVRPKLFISGKMYRFRANPEVVDGDYLLGALRSPDLQLAIDQIKTGGSESGLNLTQDRFKSLSLPLPPLPEQRRIVRKIDILSARSTTARTHIAAIEKLVERYKLAVLSGALFRDGAPVKRLGEVLTDIRYGTAAKCNYDPSGTPVLRIPNIQSGRIDRTDLKSAHFAKKEIEQLALKAGDILVIRSNGSPDLVGRAALVTDSETDCLFAGYLIRLRLSETEALPEYVRLCFESDEIRAIIEAASKSTSGVNNINSTQLKEIALPLPTVNEQHEVVRRIETAFAKIDRLKAEAAKALKLLGHLDQRILAKAFAGDLVPQDPNDEPAEALLARISEARAAAPKGKRGRKAKA